MKKILLLIACVAMFAGCSKEETTCKLEVQHWYQHTFNSKVYYSSGDKVYCIKGTEGEYSVDEKCFNGEAFNVSKGTYQQFSMEATTSSGSNGSAFFNVPSNNSYLLVAISSWGYAYKFVVIPSDYTTKMESVIFVYDKEDHVGNWIYVKKK